MVLPDKMPTIPQFKAPLMRPRIVPRMRVRVVTLRNLRMDIRPLSLRQPVRIKSSDLVLPSPRPVYDGIPYLYVGDYANWKVEYENTTLVELPFSYEQKLETITDAAETRLLAKGSLPVSTLYSVPKAKTLSASAKAMIRGRILDSVTKGFDIGIMEYKEKPMTEYPESEGYNEDLTSLGGYDGLKALWSRVQKPNSNLTISWTISATGGVMFEGIYYRAPGALVTFRFTVAITNKLSTDQKVDILGPTIGVIYDDKNHATWVGGTFRDVTVPANSTKSFSYDQKVPAWMYGTVVVLNGVYTPPAATIYYIPYAEYKVGELVSP